jgi:transcriptional regulator with XRE-family HTH domain
MGIGERIKNIRGEMRQEDFSDMVGVHLNTAGRWEREQRTPDINDLNKILAAFPEISPAWLLTGEGAMNRVNLFEPAPDVEGKMAVKFKLIRGDIPVEAFCRDFHWYKEGWESIEEGKNEPGWVLIYRVCHDLGISPSWMIENEGPMKKADVYITDIDPILVTLVYEVIEEIDSDPPLLSIQQKSELFSFVYQMNKGSRYTKERLKRFIEAVCSFIEQGIDFNKLSDRKLSNIMIEIAHHVVKGGDEEQN